MKLNLFCLREHCNSLWHVHMVIEWVHKCHTHSVVDLQLSFRLEGITLGILIAHDILDYSRIIKNNAGIMESSTQYGDQVQVTTKKQPQLFVLSALFSNWGCTNFANIILKK